MRWRTPRMALAGFVIAMLVVSAVSAWLSPLAGADWTQWTRPVRHVGDPTWSWIARHFTFADVMAYAVAHSTWVHTIVTPLACLALVIGAFTLALGRLPHPDSWDDVLGVMAVSALLWIGQPRPGFVLLFHRPHVAWHVYGCALALWTIAPFRCGWRPRGGLTVALALAAFLVGTTTRQLALATLVTIVGYLVRTPRADRGRWMGIALAALVPGTILGWFASPRIEIGKVVNRGLEHNLLVVNLSVREGGQIVAAVLLLVLAKLALDLWKPSPAPALPDAGATHRWFWIWFGLCVVALFGPRFGEASLLPATLVLCAAALPWMLWLAGTRLRAVVIGLAVGVHVVMWTTGLVTFAELGGEFRERIAVLERTPKGSVAVIRPYSEVLPNPWFHGEDWFTTSRQLVAIDVFGLADIDFAPTFRKLETNPRLVIRLEVEGATDAEVRAAAPARWATDLTHARTQFEGFARGLQRKLGKTFTARLVVDNLPFPERAERPLHAAWYEGGRMTSPRIRRTNPGVNDEQSVTMPAPLARRMGETYLVREAKGTPIKNINGNFELQPMRAGLLAIVACDPKRCFAVDAWLPRF